MIEFVKRNNQHSIEQRRSMVNKGILLPLRNLAQTAKLYDPSDDLLAAMNTAITLQKPLLLLGEPGTGKTQAAYYLANYFGCETLHKLSVRSSARFEDLFYHFDAVRYYRDAQLAHLEGQKQKEGQKQNKHRAEYIEPGPLWEAIKRPAPQVLLIDEIDKAPRDFPNDLLNALDQFEFRVPELYGCEKLPDNDKLKGAKKNVGTEEYTVKRLLDDDGCEQRAPIVIITSNNVEQLPEPFLRRCVFHYIKLTPEHLKRIALRHKNSLEIQEQLLDTLITRFYEIRDLEPQKLPSTAEFLEWAYMIVRDKEAQEELVDKTKLPYKYLLLKNQEDIEEHFPSEQKNGQ